MCKTVFSSNSQCKNAADMYIMGTTMFGMQGYYDSQQDNCECIDNSLENITQHYVTLVENFYKEYAPDKQSKVDSGTAA